MQEHNLPPDMQVTPCKCFNCRHISPPLTEAEMNHLDSHKAIQNAHKILELSTTTYTSTQVASVALGQLLAYQTQIANQAALN